MAAFRVIYPDGSVAKRTKVTLSVDRGGMAYGITDDRGYVTIHTSNNYGKIIVNGKTIHNGNLDIGEVVIR